MAQESVFTNITNLRKIGKLKEAYDLASKALEQSPNDKWIKSALFWVYYAYIKEQVAKISSRDKKTSSGTEYAKPNSDEIQAMNKYIDALFALNIPVEPMNYSALMLSCKNFLDSFPKLIDFIITDGHYSKIFEEAHLQPYNGGQYEASSLLLSIAKRCAKGWYLNREVVRGDFEDLLAFLKFAREECKDKAQNKIWLDYEQAKCYISVKQFSNARKFIVPILQKNQNLAWAWACLATTYVNESPESALILYAKAILLYHDENHSVRTLEAIIPLLLEANMPKEASMALNCHMRIYKKNSWKIKDELLGMIKADWFIQETDESIFKAKLLQLAAEANSFLYSTILKYQGIIENIHRSGKGFHMYVDRNKSISVEKRKYNNKKGIHIGEAIEIIVGKEGEFEHVIGASSIDSLSTVDIHHFEGTLKVAEKGFGFVNFISVAYTEESVFIPAHLVKQLSNKIMVKGVCVRSFDKVKKKDSWKAISLEEKN